MAKNKGKAQRKDPMSNVRTMGREGMHIIRDIAFGNYNIYNEGHVFRNLNFVRSTLTEVDKRIMDLQIHITAISYAYHNSDNPAVVNLKYRDEKSLEGYTLVRNVLCSIIASGGDTGFLTILANKLPAYRYNI